MKKALIGTAYLISGAILIGAVIIADNGSVLGQILGVFFGVIGVIITLIESFRQHS